MIQTTSLIDSDTEGIDLVKPNPDDSKWLVKSAPKCPTKKADGDE